MIGAGSQSAELALAAPFAIRRSGHRKNRCMLAHRIQWHQQ
jgi:hypothetical protein